jgi:hypothetical protein
MSQRSSRQAGECLAARDGGRAAAQDETLRSLGYNPQLARKLRLFSWPLRWAGFSRWTARPISPASHFASSGNFSPRSSTMAAGTRRGLVCAVLLPREKGGCYSSYSNAYGSLSRSGRRRARRTQKYHAYPGCLSDWARKIRLDGHGRGTNGLGEPTYPLQSARRNGRSQGISLPVSSRAQLVASCVRGWLRVWRGTTVCLAMAQVWCPSRGSPCCALGQPMS